MLLHFQYAFPAQERIGFVADNIPGVIGVAVVMFLEKNTAVIDSNA